MLLLCGMVAVKSSKNKNNNKKSLHRLAAKLFLSDLSIPADKLKIGKLLPLTKQLRFSQVVMMFKVSSGETPDYIPWLFTRSTSRYGSNNFIPPRPRTDLHKTSLAFSGSSVRNSLPNSIKKCEPPE